MNFSQLGFGLFSVKIYGVLVSLSFMAASWYFYRRLRSKEFPIDFFVHHFWRWILGAVGLGRLFALIFEPDILIRHGMFAPFAVWDGGIHSLGAIIGALIVMFWDLRKKEPDIWQWLDVAIFPIFFATILNDFAAFLTGASYGIETLMPWGIRYETFGVDILAPVHPVTLYAAVFHMILFRWLVKSELPLSRFPGRLTKLAGFFFFLTEFFLQFLRGDATFEVFGFIRIEQLMAFVAVVFFAILLKRPKVR